MLQISDFGVHSPVNFSGALNCMRKSLVELIFGSHVYNPASSNFITVWFLEFSSTRRCVLILP